MSKLTVCLRHISEVFLYEYYCLGYDEYEISEEDTLTLYKTKAKELLLSGDYSKAQQALDCYRMVYDLTADEEVGKIISKIVR